MIKWMKSLYGKMRMSLYKRSLKDKVIFEKGTVISTLTKFEGHNRVAQNAKVINSEIGYGTLITPDADICNTKIGRYSQICNVKIIRGQHPINFVSTHAAFYSLKKQVGFTYAKEQSFEEYKFADEEKRWSVIIGNDVWITRECTVIEGVTIGDGAVILPGAVVNKDVPPYAVVGGVPAKIVRYRFDEDTIEWLKSLKWWDKDEEWLRKYAPYFSDPQKLREALKEN